MSIPRGSGTASPGAPPPPARFAPLPADGGGLSLYRAVRRALLQAIESGAVAPGQALPSESVLAHELGVSIGTLRRAVDELVAEHILMRRQGLGTFVATHTADRFLFQFFHVERSDGLREVPRVELLEFSRIRLDEEAAEALALRPGEPGIQVDNRLLLQGRPVMHDRIKVSAALFRGLTQARLERRPSTIYHLYQVEFGITVVRALERARAVAADRSAARILGVAMGAPLMQIRRTALTFGDKPVEYRVSVLDSALHEYVHLLSRPG
jgi:GntR family transcriptional regulator